MEIQHIRVFRALAEEGSMTRAASRLSVTQPAVSFAIAQLERELGLVLFHRSRSGLMLTLQGEALLARAQNFLALAEELANFGKDRSATSGPLRVAGRQGFMQYVFPYLVRKLNALVPNIRLEQVTSGSSADVIEAVKTGRADLGFSAVPGIKSIVGEVLFEDPVWLAASRADVLSRKRKINPHGIGKIRLCIPTSGDRLRPSIDRFIAKLGQKPEIVLETNDYTLMKSLIELGECSGFIYAHMLLGTRKDSIAPLDVQGLSIKRDLTILHRRDDLLPHVAHARQIFITEANSLLLKNVERFIGK